MTIRPHPLPPLRSFLDPSSPSFGHFLPSTPPQTLIFDLHRLLIRLEPHRTPSNIPEPTVTKGCARPESQLSARSLLQLHNIRIPGPDSRLYDDDDTTPQYLQHLLYLILAQLDLSSLGPRSSRYLPTIPQIRRAIESRYCREWLWLPWILWEPLPTSKTTSPLGSLASRNSLHTPPPNTPNTRQHIGDTPHINPAAEKTAPYAPSTPMTLSRSHNVRNRPQMPLK